MSEHTPHPSGEWPRGLERGLRNFWYPICRSEEVQDTPVGITRLCGDLVVWRDSEGTPHTFDDRCPHRGAALSIGRLWGDLLECKYHGFVFDGTGQCRDIPTERHGGSKAAKIRVPNYPTVEVGGAIWAFMHDGVSLGEPSLEVPPELVDPEYVGWWTPWVFDTNWLLVQDNNADVLHVPFLHDPTYQFGQADMAHELRVRDIEDGFITELVDAPAGRTQSEIAEGLDAFVFKLPAMVSLWLPPRAIAWIHAYNEDPSSEAANPRTYDDEPPYRAVQWMLPMDENHTLFMSWYGRRCKTDAEQAHWKELYHTRIQPSEEIVQAQDNEAFRSLRGLEQARRSERLFNLDIGTIKMRKLLRDTYLAQQLEPTHAPGANNETAPQPGPALAPAEFVDSES